MHQGGGQTAYIQPVVTDGFMPRINQGWRNYSHQDYARSTTMDRHSTLSSRHDDLLSLGSSKRSGKKGYVNIGGDTYGLDQLTESDLASLTQSQTLQILSSSSVTSSQLTGKPEHLQVYDRLIRDLRIKKLAQTQPTGPKNSLPPLPKRPVRKKWGLSAPYSSTFQQDAENERKERRERSVDRAYMETVETRGTPLSVSQFRSSHTKRFDPQQRSKTELMESPTPSNLSRSTPHQILFRPYQSWGSGFRAPSKNEFYEEEVKRQEALTAVLRVPQISGQPRARTSSEWSKDVRSTNITKRSEKQNNGSKRRLEAQLSSKYEGLQSDKRLDVSQNGWTEAPQSLKSEVLFNGHGRSDPLCSSGDHKKYITFCQSLPGTANINSKRGALLQPHEFDLSVMSAELISERLIS